MQYNIPFINFQLCSAFIIIRGLSLVLFYSNRIRARRLCYQNKPLYSIQGGPQSYYVLLWLHCNGTCRTRIHECSINNQNTRSPERIHPPGRRLRSGVRPGMVHPVIRVLYRRGSLPQARLNSSQPHNKVLSKMTHRYRGIQSKPCFNQLVLDCSIYSFIHPVSWSKAYLSHTAAFRATSPRA